MTSVPMERLVRDMHQGEEGWIVPWGLCVSNEGEVFGVNARYTVDPDQRGTICVRIRMKEGRDGTRYVVVLQIPRGYKFSETTWQETIPARLAKGRRHV